MSDSAIWTVIVLGMAATYASRLSFIALLPAERLPAWLRRALRFVPPAVLSALVTPELLRPSGSLDLTFSNPRLIAGIAASLVAWRLRSTWATLAVGLVVYLLLAGI